MQGARDVAAALVALNARIKRMEMLPMGTKIKKRDEKKEAMLPPPRDRDLLELYTKSYDLYRLYDLVRDERFDAANCNCNWDLDEHHTHDTLYGRGTYITDMLDGTEGSAEFTFTIADTSHHKKGKFDNSEMPVDDDIDEMLSKGLKKVHIKRRHEFLLTLFYYKTMYYPGVLDGKSVIMSDVEEVVDETFTGTLKEVVGKLNDTFWSYTKEELQEKQEIDEVKRLEMETTALFRRSRELYDLYFDYHENKIPAILISGDWTLKSDFLYYKLFGHGGEDEGYRSFTITNNNIDQQIQKARPEREHEAQEDEMGDFPDPPLEMSSAFRLGAEDADMAEQTDTVTQWTIPTDDYRYITAPHAIHSLEIFDNSHPSNITGRPAEIKTGTIREILHILNEMFPSH